MGTYSISYVKPEYGNATGPPNCKLSLLNRTRLVFYGGPNWPVPTEIDDPGCNSGSTIKREPVISTSTGTQIGDVSVSGSQYGLPIPLVYGSMRLSGNTMWAGGIFEKETTDQTEPDSNGDYSIDTNFSYFGSFAVALAEGVVDDVVRIWANERLIYDRTGTTVDVAIDNLRFTLYSGNETQEADPVIEAVEGVGTIPAFRGLAYVVFESMPLGEFKNSIPALEFEVIAGLSGDRLQTLGAPLYTDDAIVTSERVVVNWQDQYAYYVVYGTAGRILRVNMKTGLQDRAQLAVDAFTTDTGRAEQFGSLGQMMMMPDNSIITTSDSGNSAPIVRLNVDSLTETSRFGIFSTNLSFLPTVWRQNDRMGSISFYDETDSYHYYVGGNNASGSIGVLMLPDLDFIWSSSEPSVTPWFSGAEQLIGICQGVAAKGFGEAWVTRFKSDSTTVYLYKLTVSKGANWAYDPIEEDVYNGTKMELWHTFDAVDLCPTSGGTLTGIQNAVYNQYDGTLLLMAGESGGDSYMSKYDPITDTIIWMTDAITSAFPAGGMWNQARTTDYMFGWMFGDNGIMINTLTGVIIHDFAAPNWAVAPTFNYHGVWDSKSQSWVSALNTYPFIRFFFNRNTGTGSSLGDIVADLSTRSGIALSDIDTTDIDGTSVPGFIVDRQASSRVAIDQLAEVYLFDGFESDYKIKFEFRGKTVVASMTEAELAYANTATGDVVIEERIQEVELPQRMTIRYMNRDLSYRVLSHFAKRTLAPDSVTDSNNQQTVTIPAAMNPDVAKQQVENMLYTEWMDRQRYKFKWPWSKIALDPSDVIAVTLDDGTEMRTRITDVDIGNNLTIEAESRDEIISQYSSTVISYSGEGYVEQTIVTNFDVKGFLIDCPFLADADSPIPIPYNLTFSETTVNTANQSWLHSFVGGRRDGGFISAEVHVEQGGSPDSFINYRGPQYTIRKHIYGAAWGTCLSIMPDPDGVDSTDITSELTVAMSYGADTLAEATTIDMLNGANRAILVKVNGECEIIHFKYAVNRGSGVWALSEFIRGRRGTDTMAYNHTAGEFIVFISNVPEGTDRSGGKLSDRSYSISSEAWNTTEDSILRYVGYKELFRDGESIAITSQHRTNACYASTNFKATENATDLDLTWTHRDRFGSDLVDGHAEITLSEDSLKFEIDILDGPGGTVVRTVASLIIPSYTYLNADIITDFGSIPLTLYANIYQLNDHDVRGFSRELKADVV